MSFWTKRTVQIVPSKDSLPGKIVLFIDMNGLGGEAAIAFTLGFDSTRLTNPIVELAPGASPGTILTTNAAKSDAGQLAVRVDSNESLTSGRLMTVTFDLAANSSPGTARIMFTNALAQSSAADAEGNLLPIRFINEYRAVEMDDMQVDK
jgi:hypothetical protein